jgi:predicted porin
MKYAVLSAAILAALAGLAPAALAESSDNAPETKGAGGAGDTFHWNGLTLYGVVDVGIANQSHGTPLSDYYAQGIEYGISSNSNHSVTALAPNGLSQSRIGLRGTHALTDEWSGIFTVETRFSPLSGEIANGPKSLVQNNGVALANQVSASDSSQAGQLFSAAAFGGVTSKTYGTFTIGRQNGLLYDNVLAYDPNGGSYAFSLIGFSAITAGAGDSEYNRLNGSARYTNQYGPVRFGVQFQPAGQEVGGAARQANLGADVDHLSLDLTYVSKRNAIALGTYSPTAAQLSTLQAEGLSLNNSLKATISDNTAWSLMARYDLGSWRAYAGYERISYGDPNAGSAFTQVGSSTVGGYFIGAITTNAYVNDKVLQVEWAGLKYEFSPKIRLTGAFYRYDQNSFATGKSAGCSTTSSTGCSGAEIAYSLVAEYQYNRYFDFYAGALRSGVSGGLASGFLNNSTVSTTAGVRLSF